MKDKNLVFIHVPKAAGSTLRKIIKIQYPSSKWLQIDGSRPQESYEEFKNKTIEERKKIQCLFGHIPYGVHEALVGSSQYITILRHPVERIISHYYYVLRKPEHYLYQEVTSENMSLHDYVSSGIADLELRNGQTRLISGINSNNLEALSLAKSNIKSHFLAVGITERFEQSLAVFKHYLKWNVVQYESTNVTTNRPKKGELSKKTLDLIERLNYLDMELYQFSNYILDKDIQNI